MALIEMSTTDLREDVAGIKQPLLVLGSIYGTKDNSEKLLRQQYKNAPHTIIEGAESRHFIMYDQPQWMYEKIEEFLKR